MMPRPRRRRRAVVLRVRDGVPVSDRRLRRCEAIARRNGLPIVVHLVGQHTSWWWSATGHIAMVPDHLIDPAGEQRRSKVIEALRQRGAGDVELLLSSSRAASDGER